MFICVKIKFDFLIIIILFMFVKNSKSDDLEWDDGRIVNGQVVSEGKYPFIASLQTSSKPCGNSEDRPKPGEHFCGGAVINDNTVLTAAHCFRNVDVKNVFVLVGVYNMDASNISDTNCYQADKLMAHPWYTGNSQKSPDIGVVKLKKKIVFKNMNKRVTRVCLPQPNENPLGNCIIMGWGTVGRNSIPLSRRLLEKVVTAVRSKEFSGKEMHYKIEYKHSHGGACFGDSGGPMVCSIKGDEETLFLFGVDSFVNIKECTGITAYTNVALYNDWIKQQAED